MTSALYLWNHKWNSLPFTPDLVSHTSCSWARRTRNSSSSSASMMPSWSWDPTWTPKMSAQISLLSDSSIPNATILSVTFLRKWIAQNSTNKKTHLSLNAKEIAVSPSVPSARRFFSLDSWSTRKSTSSLKDNFSFFWWTSRGPTITGCFPLCLFTSSRCSYWVAVTLKGPKSNVGSTWNTEKCLGFVQNLAISFICQSNARTAAGSGAATTFRTYAVSFALSSSLHWSTRA